VSLRQARRNEHFCILSRSDQDCILRHVWDELFLLHASYWPIDVSALIRRAINNDHINQHGAKAATSSVITNSTSRLLCRSLELCQNLQLDAVELSLMETLILCRKGKMKNICRSITACSKLSHWDSRTNFSTLRAVALSRRTPLTFVMSVRLSASIIAVPTGWISIKFDTENFYKNMSKNNQICLKSRKHFGHYTEI
jgi:hypothetical protein